MRFKYGLALALGMVLCYNTSSFAEGRLPDQPYRSPIVNISAGGGHGTAFYLGKGVYVTAGHVCALELDDHQALELNMSDGEIAKANTILAFDRIHDVCILQSQDVLNPTDVLKLACESPVAIGDKVTLQGYPLDLPMQTSTGYVTALHGKWAHWSDVDFMGIAGGPGNSGSPVLNSDTGVIGVLVGGAEGTGLVAFVPIKWVCNFEYQY